jgi:hypothetical protein
MAFAIVLIITFGMRIVVCILPLVVPTPPEFWDKTAAMTTTKATMNSAAFLATMGTESETETETVTATAIAVAIAMVDTRGSSCVLIDVGKVASRSQLTSFAVS